MSEEKSVILTEAPPPDASAATTPDALISLAIRQGLTPEGLKIMAEVYERMQAKAAEKAYAEDMAGFQREVGVILKNKVVHFPTKTGGTFNSRFASMDALDEGTRELRGKYGFSYRFIRCFTDTQITADCEITHREGHKTLTSFSVPAPREAGKLSIQHEIAGIVTFCERYAFRGGFGISTGDPDDDGKAFTQDPITPEQVLIIAKLLDDLAPVGPSFWAFCGLEQDHNLERLPRKDFARVQDALLQRKQRMAEPKVQGGAK